jgi:acetolactate synthase-1/2/3 large subunit
VNVAQLVVRCLENEGVRFVFGIPGEETLALNAALAESDKVKFIVVRHEQGAAFMADVYGRLSTFPGVCLATLGPGATNLLTGVADANLDRAPLVAITGQARLERVHKESHQNIDVVRMFEPVTKWNARIELPETAPEVVRKAFRLARLEKPGATHIELPEDVAEEKVDARPVEVRRTTYPEAKPEALERAAAIIAEASRPIVLAGNGVVRRHAAGNGTADALREFVSAARIPAVHTFMAKGVLPAEDAYALPAVGLQRAGADLRNVEELAHADVVICVGYDLVEWAPAFWNPKKDKSIVHVDSLAAEIDGHYIPAVEVVGEIGESLRALAALCVPRESRTAQPRPSKPERDDGFPMSPRRVVSDLRSALGEGDVVVCDVGAHKVWLARFYPASQPNTIVIANGLSAMGIALPGAIAAKLLHPERKVVAFTGRRLVPHERAGAGDGEAARDGDRGRCVGRRALRRHRGERTTDLRPIVRSGVRESGLRGPGERLRDPGLRGVAGRRSASDATARPRRGGSGPRGRPDRPA